MNSTQIAKQMLDFQKTTFDNFFNAAVMVQEQGEKMTNAVFEQASWLPEENKRLMDQWLTMAKKGRDDFKSALDYLIKNFTHMAICHRPGFYHCESNFTCHYFVIKFCAKVKVSA